MNLKYVLQLARFKVSLAVAFGSLCGAMFYVLRYESLPTQYYSSFHQSGYISLLPIGIAAIGAFFVCAGCSALNQVQECKRDARMQRTKNRPLPLARLSKGQALAFSGSWLTLGAGLWFLAGGWQLLAMSVLIVLSYNGLYTPLKPVTPLALLAGGVAGACPPLIGWLAAGGSFMDPSILALIAIFYLWQVPHFWLLAEKHREDYLRAGFALPATALPTHKKKTLLLLWVVAYFASLSCYALGAGVLSPALALACLLAAALAALAIATNRLYLASLAIDSSLPLALGSFLLIIL